MAEKKEEKPQEKTRAGFVIITNGTRAFEVAKGTLASWITAGYKEK